MIKQYNVCTHCWHKEMHCKCPIKRLRPIDHNMIYILNRLNNKGYKTRFCCGGHTEKKFIYIYIQFMDQYSFALLPDHFVYKNFILCYKNKKLKTKKEMQSDINKKIKILKKWADIL